MKREVVHENSPVFEFLKGHVACENRPIFEIQKRQGCSG
jgi:hypothetical protein